MEQKNDQGMWNFIFATFFVLEVTSLGFILYEVNGELPNYIPLADFLLICLAVFRVTRLFVYDKIARFARDWLVMKKEFTENGVVCIDRVKYTNGPLRTFDDLLNCPWCMGVWNGSIILFFYFLTPYAWLPILLFAVAGIGTFIQ